MLTELAKIVKEYISGYESAYKTGLAGIWVPSLRKDRMYIRGLLSYEHYSLLLHALLNDSGSIDHTFSDITNNSDKGRWWTPEYPEIWERNNKFKCYIVKFTTYKCCLSYLLDCGTPESYGYDRVFAQTLLNHLLTVLNLNRKL